MDTNSIRQFLETIASEVMFKNNREHNGECEDLRLAEAHLRKAIHLIVKYHCDVTYTDMYNKEKTCPTPPKHTK